MSEATVTVHMGRKINLGNYETTDLQVGASIPVGLTEGTDLEGVLHKAIAECFSLVAPELSNRVAYVKAMQSGAQMESFEDWLAKRK